MEKTFSAYVVTNTITQQKYVGGTKSSLAVRWYHHVKVAPYGNTPIAQAMREWGEAAFLVQHVACARNPNDLDAVEAILIKQEHSHVSEGGYNRTWSGQSGGHERKLKPKLSPAVRLLLKEVRDARIPNARF